MKRNMLQFWISLIVFLSLVAIPAVVYAQEGTADPEPEVEVEVGQTEPGEGEKEGEGEPGDGNVVVVPPEAGEGDEGDEGGDMEGGAAEGGEMKGGADEAPEYLPVTGGTTQATTSMFVLAVLGLLFAGAFVKRTYERVRS